MMFLGRKFRNNKLPALHEADDLENPLTEVSVHRNVVFSPRAADDQASLPPIENASLLELDEELFKCQPMRCLRRTARTRCQTEGNRGPTCMAVGL